MTPYDYFQAGVEKRMAAYRAEVEQVKLEVAKALFVKRMPDLGRPSEAEYKRIIDSCFFDAAHFAVRAVELPRPQPLPLA